MQWKPFLGRTLLMLALVGTAAFHIIVDWTSDHVTSPEWSAHAKYHLIVYHLSLLFFCAVCVIFCWAAWNVFPRSPEGLLLATVLVWAPFFIAAAFPQATPYATAELAKFPVPAQFFVGAIAIAVAVLGRYLLRF